MKTIRTLLTLSALGLWQLHSAALPPGRVVGWGSNIAGEATGTPSPESYFSTGLVAIAGQVLSNVVAVSAGKGYSLALMANGTVFGWGSNAGGEATGVKADYPHKASVQHVMVASRVLSNVTAIFAGGGSSLALMHDGTVAGWGGGLASGNHGHLSVPPGLSNVIAIAAGWSHSIALKRDGTVAGWGDQPVPLGLSNITAIAAGGGGYAPNLALGRDGTVFEWSTGALEPVPSGLGNVVAVAAGEGHSLALKSDGTVVGWGSNRFGEATGVATTAFPHYSSGVVVIAGQPLSNVTAIAADSKFSLALRRDGTVVTWGYNGFHQADVPAGLKDVVAVAAGEGFCLAITTNSNWAPLGK